MSTQTTRNIDDDAKPALCRRAVEHGVSMEQEVRSSFAALSEEQPRKGAWRLRASKDEILALA
jgi:plasmid stability protein